MIRNYSDTVQATSLASSLSSVATSLTVTNPSTFPSVPFTIAIERGSSNVEVCLVTAVAGATFTIERGFDFTASIAHSSGASVEHVVTSTDFSDANAHVANSSRDDHTQYLSVSRAQAVAHGYYNGTQLAMPQALATGDTSIGTDFVLADWTPLATFATGSLPVDRKFHCRGIVGIMGASLVEVGIFAAQNIVGWAATQQPSRDAPSGWTAYPFSDHHETVPVMSSWWSLPANQSYTVTLAGRCKTNVQATLATLSGESILQAVTW